MKEFFIGVTFFFSGVNAAEIRFKCSNTMTLLSSTKNEDFCFDNEEKITYSKNCHLQSCEALNLYEKLKNSKKNTNISIRKNCEDFKLEMQTLYDEDKNEYCFCLFPDSSKIDCNNILIF